MDEEAEAFIDKLGRTISLGYDDEQENIVAEYNGQEIGRFEFASIDEDNPKMFLAHMNVNASFQRCGIGVELIKLAEELHQNFLIISHLSIEGAALLNHCKNKGIFKYHHALHSDSKF